MIEKWLARQHRILIVAELRQGRIDERRKGRLGIGASDGEPKRTKIAEMIAKPCLDQFKDLLRNGGGRAVFR
jgi:hypothetical protein